MLSVLLLAVVVCVTNAALPCQAPAELTFRAARHDYADTTFQRFYAEYDRNNQRVVLFDESFSGGTRDAREFLFLHRIGSGFNFDFRTRQCQRFPVGPFRPFEIPYNATFEYEYVLGGPSESVTVDRWSDRIPGRTRETWVGEFSLGTCYPISQFLLDFDNFNNTAITHYYDVVQGIVNPNDFDVPQECFNATFMPEMPYEARVARSFYYRAMQ
jgi:hypothetical protein